MGTISIRRRHVLSHDQARQAGERVAQRLRRDHGLQYQWQDDTIHFSAPGVDGTLHITPKTVRLDAELGIFMSLVQSRIEREIDASFQEYFGRSGGRRRKA